MGKAILKNNLGFSVKVTEGNAGIFRTLKVLEKGESMTIAADANATYREYLLIKLPDNKELRPLSSDDIQELQDIEIYEAEPGEFDWRELPKSGTSDTQPKGKNPGDKKMPWYQPLRGLFSSKSGNKADAKAEANAGSSEA